MSLSEELISQFAKLATGEKETDKETTVYGTIVYNGKPYVKLDGSELLTPITTTTDVTEGERVTVLIKNHTATVTGNISSPAARTDRVEELGTKVSDFEIVIADKVSTKEFDAEVGRIDTLVSDNVTIKNTLEANSADITTLKADNVTINETLTANTAEIENLKTTKLDTEVADIKYATVENLEATNADIRNLDADYGDFKVLTTDKLNAYDADISKLKTDKLNAYDADIKYATIESLETTDANVTNLDADVADINTLIFGTAAGDTIHTSFSNAVIAQLGVAQIKSAMIDSVSADKITAGDIVTNNVRVMSEDGKLLISDETIQISDDTRVRVQIGKDASGDYSINVWDVDGNLMFSEGGITDNAIKDAIIRNDMVSENANISASKLDIDSLFTEINGSSKTIKSSKIYLNEKEQTLDVAFTAVTTELSNMEIGGRNLLYNSKGDFTTDTNSYYGYWTLADATYSHGVVLEADQSYTLSFDWEVDWGEVEPFSGILTSVGCGGTEGWFEYDVASQAISGVAVNTSGRVIFTFIPTETALTDRPYFSMRPIRTNSENTLDGTVWTIRNLKLEKGNKATDWTPAPEDLETKVTSQGTQLNAIIGKIESSIWQQDIDTATDKMETKYSNLVQDLDGFKTTVSDTYTTKEEFQNLTIGGRNLLYNSRLIELHSNNPSLYPITCEEMTENDISFYRVKRTDSSLYPNTMSLFNTILKTTFNYDEMVGQQVTLSFKARASRDITTVFMNYAYSGSTTTQFGKQNETITTDWKTFYITIDEFPVIEDGGGVRWCPYMMSLVDGEFDTFYLDVRDWKFEKGNKATDWTPAPEDVESEITTVKTSITQTDESITSLAERTTAVEDKFGNYSTTEEMNSAIEQTAESITTTVSATINDIAIGGRNLLTNSDTEVTKTSSDSQPEFIQYADLAPIFDEHGIIEYTLSFDIKSLDTTNSNRTQVYCQNGSGAKYFIGYTWLTVTTEYTRQSITFTPEIADETLTKSMLAFFGTYETGNIPCVKNVKLEKGNKATDWTPAPEDYPSKTSVEENATKIAAAESSIQQLADSIVTFVTDGDGNSMLTQTSTGWTFSTSKVENDLESLSDGLDELVKDLGDTDAVVSVLQQSVSDIGVKTDYVNIGTCTYINDSDIEVTEPCIELGESENDYKVLITNTHILFKVGSSFPTRINANGLITENITVENELRQTNDAVSGFYVWSMDENGYYGLLWKESDE